MINTIDCKQDLEWITPIFPDNGNVDDVKINDIKIIDNEIYRKPSLLDTALLQSLGSYKKNNLTQDKADTDYSNHLLQKNISGFNAQIAHPDISTQSEIFEEINEIAESYNKKCKKIGMSQFLLAPSELNIAGQIGDLIGNVKENYYDIFEGALSKYVQFYKEFSDITSKMSNFIHSVNDEGQLKYDFKKLDELLKTLLNDYTPKDKLKPLDKQLLYPKTVEDIKEVTLTQVNKWAKDMGLPASSIKGNFTDGYYIAIDTHPLENMIKNLIHNDKNDFQLYNTEYQAWLTSFNAQEDQIKTTVQSLTGRFGNANAVYDNMVKVLSSTISSLAEMYKRFFAF